MAQAAQDLLSGLLDVAHDYVRQRVSISLKTNYGPEIPVASASLGQGADSAGARRGFGLGDLIGFRAAVIVRNAEGAVISTFGTPPETSPVRAGIALAIVAGVLFLIVRGAVK